MILALLACTGEEPGDTDPVAAVDSADTGPCPLPAPQILAPATGARVPVRVPVPLEGSLPGTWTVDGTVLAEPTWTPLATGSSVVTLDVVDACGAGSATVTVEVYQEAEPSVTVFDSQDGLPVSTRWYGLSVAPDGRVWGATAVGVVLLDPELPAVATYGTVDGLLSDIPRAVLAHSDGTVWVGHAADTLRQGEQLQPNADGTVTVLQPIDFTESEEIAAVFRLREQPYGVGAGDVWMGTNEGLNVYDADLAVFAEHAHPDHPHGYTEGVGFTPDGHIWNGDGYWLSRWNYSNDGDLSPSADRFEILYPWPVEIASPISIVDLDTDGKVVWVASEIYGVARVDVADTVGASTSTLYAAPWPTTPTALRADGVGNVWVGTSTGLYRWDGQALTFYTGEWLPSDVIHQIAVDRSTSPPTVWIATPGALVRVIGDPGGGVVL